MALTREDLESLLRWLDEDPEFRAALRRRLLAEPLIIEVRLPTDWMAKVDSRLDGLEQNTGTIKQDVRSLKRDVGTLKGKVLEVEYRTKAASIFGMILRGGREASEFVSGKLEEAEIQGTVSPQEADFVMAADLLWMGTIRKGNFAGEVIVFVGENSWTIDWDDVERAAKKAEILKRAKVWAVPFVGGSEWASSEVREESLERKILCIVDGKFEPSRDNWEQLEQTLAFWKP
ncbi:MAG: hypothetical protein HZLCBSQH_001579 [Candidatus Fervidibacterota bacterium]